MAWEVNAPSDVLGQMLHPLSAEDFVTNYWSQFQLLIDGSSDKFQGLITWHDVNRIIETDGIDLDRLDLAHRGKLLPQSRFTRTATGEKKPGLDAAALTNCLSQGATLIMVAIDRLIPSIATAMDALEEVFGASINANLYASWGEDNGFDVHRDSQDIMILQVEGRKQWTIYEPTRHHPRTSDDGPKPTADPYWQGVLEAGQVLYLPRGWWHVAHPLREPSLHLTVTIVPPTGADFLSWLVEDYTENNAPVRANLPAAGTDDLTVAAGLVAGLAPADPEQALAAFLAEWKSQVRARTRVELPASPIANAQELTDATQLRLGVTRGFAHTPTPDGRIRVWSGDSSTVCAEPLWPALAQIRHDVAVTLGELLAVVPADAQRELKMTVAGLIMKGVLTSS